jgi:hypothetical protein
MSGLILLAIVIAGLVFAIKKSKRSDGGYNLPGAAPFNPTHADRNLAIDTTTDRVWIRDERGKAWMFHKSQLRTWKHQFREWRNAVYTFREYNVIEIHVADLDHPTHRIRFDRYSDKFGNQRNHVAASEWVDRLTTFING